MSSKQLTIEDWLKAIDGSGGIIETIAARLGVHRKTVWQKKKDYPEIALAIQEEVEACTDLAEINIRKLLKDGNAKVSMWYLDRKAKDRGYGNQVKVDANVANTGQVHVYLPDNGRDPSSELGNVENRSD